MESLSTDTCNYIAKHIYGGVSTVLLASIYIQRRYEGISNSIDITIDTRHMHYFIWAIL